MTTPGQRPQDPYLYTEEKPHVEGERWGASVLNDPEHLTDQARRLRDAALTGSVVSERLAWGTHEVEEPLRLYTIIPTDRLRHQGEDGQPGEFDGWYIAKEFHGGDHPILLLAPERVLQRDVPPTVDEIIQERQ